MQHAMPSSVGLWASAFVESLLNDFAMLDSAQMQTDQNPLGSAASFGSSLPIDREKTKLLGLRKVQINPIFCQNSRAKLDSYVISALFQVMLTLGKIANDDVIVFTSQEFAGAELIHVGGPYSRAESLETPTLGKLPPQITLNRVSQNRIAIGDKERQRQ